MDATDGGNQHSLGGRLVANHGRELASGHTDGRIWVWDLATGELVETLTGHKKRVNGLRYAPDGSFLASGSDDRTVRLWPRAGGGSPAKLRALIEAERSHVREVDKAHALTGASEARRRRDAGR